MSHSFRFSPREQGEGAGRFCAKAANGNDFLRPPLKPMSDNSHADPRKSALPGDLPPVQVSRHLLTWWFGLMALGGVAFGLYADAHPFGNGVLAHPLTIFFALVIAGLLTLRFLHARPMLKLISAPALAIGAAIAIACFFLGNWFGVSLINMP
jgi:hypothetical protein